MILYDDNNFLSLNNGVEVCKTRITPLTSRMMVYQLNPNKRMEAQKHPYHNGKPLRNRLTGSLFLTKINRKLETKISNYRFLKTSCLFPSWTNVKIQRNELCKNYAEKSLSLIKRWDQEVSMYQFAKGNFL